MKKVLIPLDGSEMASAILPQVRRLVKKHDAEVILVNVTVPFPATGFDAPMMIAELMDQSRVFIGNAVKRLSAEGMRVRGLTPQGLAGGTILDIAKEEKVDLIAMTTHGRSGVARWALGSIAEKVIRSSPVPLLVVRSFGDGKPVLVKEIPFQRLLIPIDGSGLSLSAVTKVCDIARPLDARAVLVHVLPHSDLPTHWTPEPPSMKEAHQALSAACIPADTIVRTGDAASEILECCTEQNCDLIAMSTHGRSGPSRWLLGSVTEKVLRASRVPMLVIPPAKGK